MSPIGVGWVRRAPKRDPPAQVCAADGDRMLPAPYLLTRYATDRFHHRPQGQGRSLPELPDFFGDSSLFHGADPVHFQPPARPHVSPGHLFFFPPGTGRHRYHLFSAYPLWAFCTGRFRVAAADRDHFRAGGDDGCLYCCSRQITGKLLCNSAPSPGSILRHFHLFPAPHRQTAPHHRAISCCWRDGRLDCPGQV